MNEPILLAHIKIIFMNINHYKNIRELLLSFILTLKRLKTTYVMRNYVSVYPIRVLTWPISCSKG